MIPTTLWIVLFFVAGVIFVFMLFFADRGERAVVQGMLIGSVVAVMAALMLLLHGLDYPFHNGVGGLKPVAMERSLRIVDEALSAVGMPGATAVRRAREPGAGVTTADGGRDRLELVAALLLAIATVATAWSGYQSTRWNGEQAKAAARANALRIESAKAAGLANTQTEVDVATFTQWINAYAPKQTELTDFYFKRFREEFRPAVNAWVATRPLKNPNAPLTPFAMPQYKLAARAEAERLDAQAEVSAAQARRNIQRASNYVLGVVLFASALFFAGMSTKLTSPRVRVAMLAIGCAVFVCTAVWIATSPVSLTV